MKLPVSTLLIITSARLLRSDGGAAGHAWKEGPRRAGSTLADAVRDALALGGRAGTGTWVLSDDLFIQKVVLNPVQVAGLTREQLNRALSFEVEPFSGIGVDEAVVGFSDRGGGTFEVVEMPRVDRDGVLKVVTEAGGRTGGIAHTAAVPVEEAALRRFLDEARARLEVNLTPVIEPPAPLPSPYRFVALGIALAAGALGLILALTVWNALQLAVYTRAQEELGLAARDLAAVNVQNEALRKELAVLGDQEAQRKRIALRRDSLPALLRGLAATRPEDVIIREMKAEGPSVLVVNGVSLEAEAVDEFSVVLTHSLRAAGWTAQLKQKTGLRRLANGGPWEFAITLTNEEALVRATTASSSD